MPRYPRNKISDVVSENLPDFVVQDHPLFVTFVEEYYKWLESQDNSYFAPMSLLGTVDIDQTTDDFLKYFKSEVFKGFPDNYTSVKGDTSGDEIGLETSSIFLSSKRYRIID